MLVNVEQLIHQLSQFPFYWLVIMAFVVTLVENIFPPAPSDVVLVAISVIAGVTDNSIIPIIIASTVGSTIGFWIMFWLGQKFEMKIIETNKLKFISKEAVHKVEVLFKKWGFKLVVVNRFISGTRAVVSFFAGLAKLPLPKTISLSAVSSFLWYGLLSVCGYLFSNRWRDLLEYLQLYDKIVIRILIISLIAAVIIWAINRIKTKKKN